jgi:hypothetical protein
MVPFLIDKYILSRKGNIVFERMSILVEFVIFFIRGAVYGRKSSY